MYTLIVGGAHKCYTYQLVHKLVKGRLLEQVSLYGKYGIIYSVTLTNVLSTNATKINPSTFPVCANIVCLSSDNISIPFSLLSGEVKWGFKSRVVCYQFTQQIHNENIRLHFSIWSTSALSRDMQITIIYSHYM